MNKIFSYIIVINLALGAMTEIGGTNYKVDEGFVPIISRFTYEVERQMKSYTNQVSGLKDVMTRN